MTNIPPLEVYTLNVRSWDLSNWDAEFLKLFKNYNLTKIESNIILFFENHRGDMTIDQCGEMNKCSRLKAEVSLTKLKDAGLIQLKEDAGKASYVPTGLFISYSLLAREIFTC